MTATEVERDAVLRRLRPLRARRAILQGTVGPATYYLGSLGDHGVVLTMCRIGIAGIGDQSLVPSLRRRARPGGRARR